MNNIRPSTPYEVEGEIETSALLLWYTPQWLGRVHVLTALMKGVS